MEELSEYQIDLAIRSPIGGPGPRVAPPQHDTGVNGTPKQLPAQNLDPIGASSPQGVGGTAAIGTPSPEMTGKADTTSGPATTAPNLGARGSRRPQTPEEIMTFNTSWRNLDLPLSALAKRYGVTTRTLERWREAFGLLDRQALMKHALGPRSASQAAQNVASEMSSAARQTVAMLKAGAATGATPVTDPKLDPLKDAEITGFLTEIEAESRKVTTHSDLAVLQRKLLKGTILIATKIPVQTWESLQTMADSLARGVLWVRKVEAGLPSPEVDQQLLRVEAGRQMMRELKSVLNDEEQAELARLMKLGADRLLAQASKPVGTPNDPPGAEDSATHNGKVRPRVRS